jgi:hypothetical protein
MDVKTVSLPALTPTQPSKRAPEQQSLTEGHRNRLKEQEAQHTARAFGANEVINAQGHITGRHVNVTA